MKLKAALRLASIYNSVSNPDTTDTHIGSVDLPVEAEKQVTDPPNNNKDYQWQRKMNQGYKGKARKPGRVLPEGTFTKEPSEMVNILKEHSDDYNQAQKKLNSYINRSGRNLQGEDKNRLYDAKEKLKNDYGEMEHRAPVTPTTPVESKQVQIDADMGSGSYALPEGHNMDDATLDTGLYDDPGKSALDGREVTPLDDSDELGTDGTHVTTAYTRLMATE